jgi:hypothetical protein
MKVQMALCLALVLCGWSSGCSTGESLPMATHGGTRQHFESFLNVNRTNEVRCLWFLQDDPRIGMEMVIHIDDKSAYTVRDVYDWAEQAAETHRLDDVQVSKIQDITSHLPPSDNNSPYVSSVFISINNGSTNKVFQYDRHYTPAVIRELYDFAGGYIHGDENN